MKNPTLSIGAIFTALLFAACDPPATFTEPQPASVSDEDHFPRRYRGTFVHDEDLTTLVIDAQSMIRYYDVVFNMPVQALDSQFQVSGNAVVDITSGHKGTVTYKGDSATVALQVIDTLFKLDEQHVLKRFKGYLFISSQSTPVSWEVAKLSLSKGKLNFSSITPQDVEHLKAITETEQDTVAPYIFAPTKKQFKSFVKQEGFRQTATYTKVRK